MGDPVNILVGEAVDSAEALQLCSQLNPDVVARLLSNVGATADHGSGETLLTGRELEVLRSVARGDRRGGPARPAGRRTRVKCCGLRKYLNPL